MNKIILMGRIVRDPEIRYGGAGSTAVAKFTLAVDRRMKKEGGQNADFPGCTAFGKTAEFVGKYCAKGTKLVVEGRIQTGSYTDRDGQKVYTTDVVVEQCEFAESRRAAEGSGTAKPQPAPDDSGFMQIPEGMEGELPFC